MTLKMGIICGKCNWLNPLDIKFCKDCKKQLNVSCNADKKSETKGVKEEPMEQARYNVCSSCYSPLPDKQKFCGKCGAATALDDKGDPNYFSELQTPGKAKLILVKGEGMDGISYHLNSDEHIAGRSEGAILFTEDKWLSPKHANFYYLNNELFVKDENSTNGIFVYVDDKVELLIDSVIMAGEQVFRIEQVEPYNDSPESDGTYFFSSLKQESNFKVIQILEGGGDGMVVLSKDGKVVIGREGCDMNFPNDPYISGEHLKIENDADKLFLTDLNSKNGTFLKILTEKKLSHGNYLFLGRQLLRVEITN